MLARANRLVTADEFRTAIRRGRRINGEFATVHVLATGTHAPARFGFVVNKKVGTAVVRNRVRRRLRAISRQSLDWMIPGTDVVIRALPESAAATWDSLQGEISEALARSSHA